MPKHSKYSPSTLNSLAVCPHYERKTTADYEQGIRLHRHLETGDKSLVHTDEEECWIMFCNNARTRVSEEIEYGKTFKEKKVSLPIPDSFGHLDELITDGWAKAAVIDWKFVRKPVPKANKNLQVQYYGAAVLYEFPELPYVDIYIVSPILEDVSKHRITREDIPKIIAIVTAVIERRKAVEKGELEDYTFNPDICATCKLAGLCPKMKEVLRNVIPGENELINLLDPSLATPEELDDLEKLAICQRIRPIVENWVSSVKEASRDKDLPGFKKRYGKSSGRILDSKVAKELALELGVSKEELEQAMEVNRKKLWVLLGDQKQEFIDTLIEKGAYAEGKSYSFPVEIKQ